MTAPRSISVRAILSNPALAACSNLPGRNIWNNPE